jgi:hypothetical protein
MVKKSQIELDKRQRLKDDFEFYARNCLNIRTKEGDIVKLELNTAQKYLHTQLKEQLKATGKVRALILKGRQQGCSTYVQARFFHRTANSFGLHAFILTHQQEATKTLFAIATRFHGKCPEFVRPDIDASNARELLFGKLDSGYRVATAGTQDTGRSATFQLFHGSEVAFWPHAETHAAGALQTVPNTMGSEIILESTSGGPRGLFYKYWKDAVEEKSDYVPIFIPWYWQDEYRKQPGPDFVPSTEERAYAEKYKLDHEQLAWRRSKIIELEGVWNFRREYPATPEEAFSAEVPGALWTRAMIAKTRVRQPPTFRVCAIAIDPSTTSKKTSNEAGMIWGGIGQDGQGYICGDETMKASPEKWARRAVDTLNDEDLDYIIYESNQGGDMVPTIIKFIDESAVCKGVTASRAKRARAEPVAALYEQERIHHVGELPALEDEMCTWDAETSNESPNRIDALVWLISKLMIKRRTKTVGKPDPDKGYTGRKWDV